MGSKVLGPNPGKENLLDDVEMIDGDSFPYYIETGIRSASIDGWVWSLSIGWQEVVYLNELRSRRRKFGAQL